MPIVKFLADLYRRVGSAPDTTDATARSDAEVAANMSSIAFTSAVIALGAKMASADGVVMPVEVEAFHKVFRTPPEERKNVDHVFALTQTDVAGYEAYAERIRTLLNSDQVLLREVLASLFYIASADRILHPKEDAFLKQIAEIFGMTESEWRFVRAQVVEDKSSPYDILGVTPADDMETISRRYRKLVRENHPDLLIGRGVPEELIVVANRQLAAITQAYATIARERGQ